MSEQENTTTENTSTNTLETRVQELETKLNCLISILKSCYVDYDTIDGIVNIWDRKVMSDSKSELESL